MYSKQKIGVQVLIFLSLLSACAIQPSLTPAVVYECNRGTTLNVQFKEISVTRMRGGRHVSHHIEKRTTDAIVTLSDGLKLELPSQKVASGFMVSNGRYTLRGKNDEATWAVGRMAEEQCILKQNR